MTAKSPLFRGSLGLIVLAAATAASAQNSSRDRYDDRGLPRGAVVPVVFNDTIDAGHARVGDRFSARVEGGRDLPRGSRLTGRIDRIDRRDGRRPAVYLRFDEARLGDGTRVPVDAVPVPLNGDFGRRDDGWFEGQPDNRAKETRVIGGAVLGGLLGSTIHKTAEGAVLGTILGGVSAETDKEVNREIAVKTGQKLGARFLQAVHFGGTTAYRNDPPRNDPPRNDPYRGDTNRDGRNRDDGNGDNRDSRSGDPRNNDPRNNDPRDSNSRDGDPYGPIRGGGRTDGTPPRDYPRRDDSPRDDSQSGDARSYDDSFAPRVYRGRDELRFSGDFRPIQRGNAVLVPLDETAKLLGVRVTRSDDTNAIYLENDRGDVQIRQGERSIRRDGQRSDLATAPVRVGNRIYVPIEVFSSLVQERLRADRNPGRA